MLFAVGIVSASAAVSSATTPTLYSAGLPIDLLCSYEGSYGSVSGANVYLYDGATRTTSASTSVGWKPYINVNAAVGAADVYIELKGGEPLMCVTTYPFNPWNMSSTDLDKLRGFVGLEYNVGASSPLVVTKVTRSYNINAPYQRSDGTIGWASLSRVYVDQYSGQSTTSSTSAYNVIPYFTDAQLAAVLEDIEDEVITDQAVVTSIQLYFERTTSSEGLEMRGMYFNNTSSEEVPLNVIRTASDNSIKGLYDVTISYDSLDWTQWLKKSVEGFMGLEIVPGLPIWGIVSAVIGIPLLVWFLRMFAGG